MVKSSPKPSDILLMANGDEPHDLTLHLYDDSELTCHRAMLCGQNQFFANALKPGRFKESSSGIIELKEDPPQAVRCMVEFLYTGKYFVGELAREKDGNRSAPACVFSRKHFAEEVVGHAEVYVIATIYDIRLLKYMASSYIEHALKRRRMIDVFPEVIEILYGGVPEVTRLFEWELLMFARRRMVALIKGDKYQRLIDSAPEFMREAVEKCFPPRILRASRFETREELFEVYRSRVEEANHLKPRINIPR